MTIVGCPVRDCMHNDTGICTKPLIALSPFGYSYHPCESYENGNV